MTENRRGAHTVYNIQCHFVWVTKYRYKMLRGGVAKRARELIRQSCMAREIRILREHVLRCFAAAAALLVVSSLPLTAQGQDTALAARHRNECRLASQVLTTGHPDTHRDWALNFIGSCKSDGPAALAIQWTTAAARGAELEGLVRSSARLRDARLYRQLRETAQDISTPPAVRVGAMLVLSRYSDPNNAIWLTDLRPPSPILRIPLIGSSGVDNAQIDGDEHIGPVASEVLALLDGIAAACHTESPDVWYAAAVLARRLRRDIEAGFAH